MDTAKVVVLGDLSVGKSTLINRACYQCFANGYRATIGLDIKLKQYKLFNCTFHLQMWDTAGQEKFRSLAVSYYRGAKAIILVFDVQNASSLNNVDGWLREAMAVQNSKNPYLFLVGSKMDLLNQETLQYIENIAKLKAKDINAEFWMVSSKTGQNVENLFERIAMLVANDLLLAKQDIAERNVILGMSIGSVQTLTVEKRKNRNKCQSSKCIK